MRTNLFAIAGLVLSLGCSQPATEQTHAPKKSASKSAASAGHGASSAEHGADGLPKRFGVPFAWESAANEPLARTRGYLRDLFRDNQEYMKNGPKFFEAFAKAQKPRATVITCSDSRVQGDAWDATPENDDFVIRNIGNQLANSKGSVEYGIEHLNTPVLLILGHTGCGAVKAAMGDTSKLPEAIRKELEPLKVTKAAGGKSEEAAWADAVVENIHAQVRTALGHFGKMIAEGQLTVIGAVYDFRNDLGKGPGRVMVVDVNGNGEPERLAAFVAALTGNAVPSDATLASPTASAAVGNPHKTKPTSGGHSHNDVPAVRTDKDEHDMRQVAEQIAQLPGLTPRP